MSADILVTVAPESHPISIVFATPTVNTSIAPQAANINVSTAASPSVDYSIAESAAINLAVEATAIPGAPGVGISDAYVDGVGHLKLVLTDSTEIDAGPVRPTGGSATATCVNDQIVITFTGFTYS